MPLTPAPWGQTQPFPGPQAAPRRPAARPQRARGRPRERRSEPSLAQGRAAGGGGGGRWGWGGGVEGAGRVCVCVCGGGVYVGGRGKGGGMERARVCGGGRGLGPPGGAGEDPGATQPPRPHTWTTCPSRPLPRMGLLAGHGRRRRRCGLCARLGPRLGEGGAGGLFAGPQHAGHNDRREARQPKQDSHHNARQVADAHGGLAPPRWSRQSFGAGSP
jgi:hypothetical protein